MEELNEVYLEEMQAWMAEFIAGRTAALERLKAKASGGGERSFDFDAAVAARQDAIEVILVFNDYLRIIDMQGRSIQHDKWGRNAITRVEDWIRDKGLLSKWIPVFMRRHGRKRIPADILNRMAWGLLVKRTKRWRRKRWYNKPKEAAIGDLYNRVAIVTPTQVAEQIGTNLKKYAKAKGRT